VQLWNKYLGERRLACRGLKVTDPALERLCDTYERALVSWSSHEQPDLWVVYVWLQQRTVAYVMIHTHGAGQ
jgi:hypothetical protein